MCKKKFILFKFESKHIFMRKKVFNLAGVKWLGKKVEPSSGTPWDSLDSQHPITSGNPWDLRTTERSPGPLKRQNIKTPRYIENEE